MSTAEGAAPLAVADLTEDGLLAALTPLLPRGRRELVGAGDDCAVLAAPARSQTRAIPRARSWTQASGVAGGRTRPTTSATGRAPIAATSARFWAAARAPISCGPDQPVEK